MTLPFGVISPQEWDLPAVTDPPDTVIADLGVPLGELEARARAATYDWLPRQFDEATGAFYGHYRAPDGYHEPPQTVNLIAPWQLLAAYDRYQEPRWLDMARRAAEWFYRHHVVDHPMSVVAGGVRDGVATDEIWTKFSAEEVITCLGLYARTNESVWLERATQCGRYLIQARRHAFAPRYVLSASRWLERGWDAWGRVVEANVLLWRARDDSRWRDEAIRWGEYALGIQAADGAFYLIDGEYYNTDLAADELRALTVLYEITGRADFLASARRFADWHLDRQLPNGAWPLTIDRDGNVVMPTIGPGDVPNIGIALLRLCHVTRDERYWAAACRAIGYALAVQVTPDSAPPYNADALACWGFWSWDPPYDYTQSPDQSTHHARGLWFLVDYWRAHGAG
jgi:hypothetical protein